ncbi:MULTISPECIES: hypothetical protein [Streptomyces]|uniref:hypothetical protein n=1 Tax=Streptomyces TaxID=1883 RepID=UPI00073E0A18|nr:hypothetical protein [Streptomyces sp. FBKL.4005]MYU28643.1 hypothetical protein [Streptomyces sp. SID7810]OYP17039.1 hypothetical protein CFC35_23115 [Streptomyces sp. FBKL.4005]CUW29682.1 hypothetical protein TUE45_04391 [Streptomyces reticuli]
MADHDAHRERFLTLTEALVGAHAFIQAVLEDLPIPVTIPAFGPGDDEDGPRSALLSLARAREIIQDEPITERYQRAYDRLILDWFTTYELLVVIQAAGDAPWRLDAAEFSLNRVVTWIEMIEEGELDDDES